MHRAFEQLLREHQQYIRGERRLAHAKDTAKRDAAHAEQELQEYISTRQIEPQETESQNKTNGLQQLREKATLAREHLEKQRKENRAFEDDRALFLKEQADIARVPLKHEHTTHKLQKEKDAILQALRQDFRDIEAGRSAKDLYADALPVSFDEKRRELLVSWNGQAIPTTIGLLVADFVWGIHYHLDAQTVPKHVQKQYAFEVAKARITLLAEEQMRIHEGTSLKIEERERIIIKGSRSKQGETSDLGIEAEYIVFTLMKSLSLDANTPFFPIHRDPYHDAILKSDIVLSIPNTSRTDGAQVASNTLPREGYQIALSSHDGSAKKKAIREAKKRLEDNLRTVHFSPLDEQRRAIRRAYTLWKTAGKPPGGPLRFLDQTTVIGIFDLLTKDIVREEERARVHAFLCDTYPVQPPAAPETSNKTTLPEEKPSISQIPPSPRQQQTRPSKIELRENRLFMNEFWIETREALNQFFKEFDVFQSSVLPLFVRGSDGFAQAYQHIQDLIEQGEALMDRKEWIADGYTHFQQGVPGEFDKFSLLKKKLEELARLAMACVLSARAYKEERQKLHDLGDEYLYEIEENGTGNATSIFRLHRMGAPISNARLSSAMAHFSQDIHKNLRLLDQWRSGRSVGEAGRDRFAKTIARSVIVFQILKRIEELSELSNTAT